MAGAGVEDEAPEFRRCVSSPSCSGNLSDHGDEAAEAWSVLPLHARRWLLGLWHTWALIEHDITCMHVSQRRKELRLKTLHIHAVCHLVLLVVTLLFVTYLLQRVLLPLLLAAGISVLMEPLVFLLVDPWVRCCTPTRQRPSLRGVLQGSTVSMELEPRPSVDCGKGQLTHMLRNALRAAWCIVAVSLAIGGVMALVSAIGTWVVISVDGMNWKKYVDGERFSLLRRHLASVGVSDLESAMHEAGVFVVQAAGLQVIGTTMAALTSFLLMVLFVGFFLVDSASARSLGKEPWRSSQRRLMAQVLQRVALPDACDSVLNLEDDNIPLAATLMGRLRIRMRTYIQAKFYLSLFKAVIIGVMYAVLDVDLWVLWTVLTFVLNFAPLGSAISTAAPLPFVFLDPEKNLLILAACLLWPLLVHNVVGNVVEPRIFANSLNLHPITVLLALTFWTAIWGVLGAIVCVPLTAMAHVVLDQVKAHPYARRLLGLMEGDLGLAEATHSPRKA